MSYEPTYLEELDQQYSDMYKDAYGIRPRYYALSEQEYIEEFARLQKVIDANFDEKRERQRIAIDKFNERVESLISCGAKDRETAIRWIDEAEEANGDREYLCYLLDLPYGYFSKKV